MRHERSRPYPSIADRITVAGVSMPEAGIARRADALLADVVAARNPRDLDMAIHRLRDMLLRVLTEGCPPSQMAGLSPVLTRMAALDRAFDCHLCSGLRPLMDRAAHAGGRVRVDPAALRTYVDHVARSGAFVAHPDARCDWSSALGPCGRARDRSLSG